MRTCDLMNRLGPGFSHVIMAVDGQTGARSKIDPGVSCEIAPAPVGKGSLNYPLAFYRHLRQARPDLMVTYNWGAFDAVMAGAISSICPVLHTEDGFGPDEWSGRSRAGVVAPAVSERAVRRHRALKNAAEAGHRGVSDAARKSALDRQRHRRLPVSAGPNLTLRRSWGDRMMTSCSATPAGWQGKESAAADPGLRGRQGAADQAGADRSRPGPGGARGAQPQPGSRSGT